jgi:hypothetical protein
MKADTEFALKVEAHRVGADIVAYLKGS